MNKDKTMMDISQVCPLAPEAYTICNEKCKECEYNIEFEQALKERNYK